MTKKIYKVVIGIIAVLLINGCSHQVAVSIPDIKDPKKFKQSSVTINLPYSKAAKNLESGLKKCAKNVRTASTYTAGGGASMPGNTFYHQFKSTNKQTEYSFRMLIGGAMEGDCMICQPKGGFYVINSSLKKSKKNKSILIASFGSNSKHRVLALQKWAEGDLSSCHNFMEDQ